MGAVDSSCPLPTVASLQAPQHNRCRSSNRIRGNKRSSRSTYDPPRESATLATYRSFVLPVKSLCGPQPAVGAAHIALA